MIKTNRFVKIVSVRELKLRMLLCALRVPVVCEDKIKVEQFKGYVLAVDLGCKAPSQLYDEPESIPYTHACTLMILHRDVQIFCRALTDGDVHFTKYSQNLLLTITMAPVLDAMRRVELTPFFTRKTQETLLAPFEAELHGYTSVKIQGHVDQGLARTKTKNIAKEQCVLSESVLAQSRDLKEKGSRLLTDGIRGEASTVWMNATINIGKLHQLSSWPNLVRRGGESFVAALAELYFLMLLNVAHVQINLMQNPVSAFTATILAGDAVTSADQCIERGFWMSGYQYRPSNPHLAKLCYRFALFTRLEGNPEKVDQALLNIKRALQLQPNDAVLLKERENINKWIRRIS